MRTPCGPRNCQLYLAVWWEGRFGYRMPRQPSKDSDQTCNIKWVQQNLSSQGPYDQCLKVRQWILYTIPRSMIEVMNHIKVQLKPTGRPEYTASQDDECVTAMNSIPLGEIMCRVHIADQSDKATATKRIEAWKYYRYNHYRGYNHAPNIVLSVNGLSASQLMTTIFSDGA